MSTAIPTAAHERLRDAGEILNEGFATLETVNRARHALEHAVAALGGAGEGGAAEADLRRELRELCALLETDGKALTRAGVARTLALAQKRVRGTLARVDGGAGTGG